MFKSRAPKISCMIVKTASTSQSILNMSSLKIFPYQIRVPILWCHNKRVVDLRIKVYLGRIYTIFPCLPYLAYHSFCSSLFPYLLPLTDTVPLDWPSMQQQQQQPEMEYRYLGNSGLKVSILSLGSWITFGKPISTRTNRSVNHSTWKLLV